MFVPYMRLDQRMPLWWRTPLVTKMKSCAIQLKEKMRSGVEPEIIITDFAGLPRRFTADVTRSGVRQGAARRAGAP